RHQDTIVILASDNSNHLLEHRIAWFSKNSMYDSSLRVPTVCVGPGFTPGAVVDVPVMASLDIARTCIDIADATPTITVDGTSLLDIAASPGDYADRQTWHGRLNDGEAMPTGHAICDA